MPSRLFMPSTPPRRADAPRSSWSSDDLAELAYARESLTHVLSEHDRGRLSVTASCGKGSLDLATPDTKLHVKAAHVSGRLNGRVIIYPSWVAHRPMSSAMTCQITIPVTVWNPETRQRKRMLGAAVGLMRSAVDHIDMVSHLNMDRRSPCQAWALVHLARLHAGGLLPGWVAGSHPLLLVAGYDRRPAHATIEHDSGMRVRFVNPMGLSVAPDVRNARAAAIKTANPLSSSARVHELDFVPIVATARLSELPTDPVELARLIRTPGIPDLLSGGHVSADWSI